MFVPLKEADMSSAENKSLLNGKGQNKETMNKQKKVLGKNIQNKDIIQAFYYVDKRQDLNIMKLSLMNIISYNWKINLIKIKVY